MLCQKHPERVHLAQQAAGKPPGLIVPVMILVDQFAEPGVPGTPLAPSGWGRGHMTQTLQLRERPSPTHREVGGVSLR